MRITLLGLGLSDQVRADSHQARQKLKPETMVEHFLLACSQAPIHLLFLYNPELPAQEQHHSQ